jgi:hypothetical protein
LTKYLKNQDFNQKINIIELLKLKFELTSQEELAFSSANFTEVIKFFKIILHTIAIQNQKQKYEIEYWENNFNQKFEQNFQRLN